MWEVPTGGSHLTSAGYNNESGLGRELAKNSRWKRKGKGLRHKILNNNIGE
jgi:hypothetical protein